MAGATVEHLFSTMLQQEQHGGKQGSPNGGDQSLLARVVALEHEKREAVLRAELERAARQAERTEQETARRIERLEQARASDALKAEMEKQAMRAEQARTKDALKAEQVRATDAMTAKMERRLQNIEQMVLRAADQLRAQMERKLLQQQVTQLQQQVSKSSSTMLPASSGPGSLSTGGNKEAGTPVAASASWADKPEPAAIMQPAPSVVRSAAHHQPLQQAVPRVDHQPAQHIVTAAMPQQTESKATSAPKSEPMQVPSKPKLKPIASTAQGAPGAMKVPLPGTSSTHFFIRLVKALSLIPSSLCLLPCC